MLRGTASPKLLHLFDVQPPGVVPASETFGRENYKKSKAAPVLKKCGRRPRPRHPGNSQELYLSVRGERHRNGLPWAMDVVPLFRLPRSVFFFSFFGVDGLEVLQALYTGSKGTIRPSDYVVRLVNRKP